MMKIIAILILSLTLPYTSKTYNAWTDTGVHLIICDNGTPDDFDDDYICDWETNRGFTVIVND